jgi:hypothetical protein
MLTLNFLHLRTKLRISLHCNNQYLIGEKLVNFLVEPKKGTKWPKELPKFKSRPDAIAVCKDLCSRQFIHRSEKVAKGELEVRTFSCMTGCIIYYGGVWCVKGREGKWICVQAAFFRVADWTYSMSIIGAICCQ